MYEPDYNKCAGIINKSAITEALKGSERLNPNEFHSHTCMHLLYCSYCDHISKYIVD